jgi:hypothetical protein
VIAWSSFACLPDDPRKMRGLFMRDSPLGQETMASVLELDYVNHADNATPPATDRRSTNTRLRSGGALLLSHDLRAMSRTGFGGDLDSRMLSWGEEILRCHVETEEVSRGVARAGVRLALESGRPIANVAADLGIHPEARNAVNVTSSRSARARSRRTSSPGSSARR